MIQVYPTNALDNFGHIFVSDYHLQKLRRYTLITERHCPMFQKGSAGRRLMFLIYVKFIWSSDIEKILNKDFENVSKCFSENKLSIHCGENKTKSILYASKCKIISAENNEDIRIKQRTHVNIFSLCVARNMFWESYRSSHQRCSAKKMFLEILYNSQENNRARVSFLIKLQPWGMQFY